MKKTRNNSLRIKRSTQKTSEKLKKINKIVEEKTHARQQAIIKKEEERLAKEKKDTLLASLDEMSYNEARKLAASLNISIYKRKRLEIIQDLRLHYEQLETTH